MTRRPPYVLILFCALLTPNALADEPRQVMWADLVPRSAAMDNPFLRLTKEQLAWVSEFLLVPWVGACIHTPPPPPNQIVHVKPAKPVEMGGMFAPVWVTGQMTTGAIKKSLSLVDGSADIEVGYSLRASRVEPYKE